MALDLYCIYETLGKKLPLIGKHGSMYTCPMVVPFLVIIPHPQENGFISKRG